MTKAHDFSRWFQHYVEPSEYRMKPLKTACGARDLAGWMQRYVELNQAGELSWHGEPATVLGIDAKIYYNLVMARGETFRIDAVAFDLLGQDLRKLIAVEAFQMAMLGIQVPWYPAIRHNLTAFQACDVLVPTKGVSVVPRHTAHLADVC